MNGFRLAGDISHLLSIIILLIKIWTSRSVAGKRMIWSLKDLDDVADYQFKTSLEEKSLHRPVF